MLDKSPVFVTIRVSDLVSARQFYEGKLGLKVIQDLPSGLMLEAGEGSRIFLYQGPLSVPEHTLASFAVANIEEAVDELIARGIVFEHYSGEEINTNAKGIAAWGEEKSAWFKDPDGHILALNQSR